MQPGSTVRERLLAAALEGAAVHGIARLSMGDVARNAGLSRQTLYKHFSSKPALVAAVVAQEATKITAEVLAAVEEHQDPRAALRAAILVALRATREHPILDRLVRTEPDSLVPFLTIEGSPTMVLVRQAAEVVVASRFPDIDVVHLRRFADIIARLLVSYAVTAPDDPPELVADAIAGLFVDGIAYLAPAVLSGAGAGSDDRARLYAGTNP